MKKILTASLVILSLSLFIAGCKTPDNTPATSETDNQTNTDDNNSNEPPVPGDPISDNEFLKSLKMPEANVGENPFTEKTFTSNSRTVSFDDEYCIFVYSPGNYSWKVKYAYKYDTEKKIIALKIASLSPDDTNYVDIDDYYIHLKEALWVPENEEEAKKWYEKKESDKTWEEWKEGQRKDFCLPDDYSWDDLVYALNGEFLTIYANYIGVTYLSYDINGNNLNFKPYIPENPTLKDFYYKSGLFYIEALNEKYSLECDAEVNYLFEIFEKIGDDENYDAFILTKITDEKLYLQSFYRKNYIIEIPYKYDFTSNDLDEWKLTITLDGNEMDCDLLFYHALIVEEGYTLS